MGFLRQVKEVKYKINFEDYAKKEWYTKDTRGYYSKENGGDPKDQLAMRKMFREALTDEEFAYLTSRPTWKYLVNFVIRFGAMYSLYCVVHAYQHNPKIWIGACILQGMILPYFGWLAHDIIHERSFLKKGQREPFIHTCLMYIGGFLGMVWPLNFEVFHLRHHHSFFKDDDTKAIHFIPKEHSRIVRFLQFSPLQLFKLGRGVQNYVQGTQSAADHTGYSIPILGPFIVRAPLLTALGMVYYVGTTYNWPLAFKSLLVPIFWFWPVAFMISRCGQHYCANPNDALLQNTCIDVDTFLRPIWHLCFGGGEYHIEHHTFPEIPMFHLRAAHHILRARVYKAANIPRFYYSDVIWGWLIAKKRLYTVWYDYAHGWENIKPEKLPNGKYMEFKKIN